nr:uncharacterized protein LOC101258273 isoform X3 [Solanum lycopersicum]
MLIHTTLYPKFHCTHKVNSSVSESTTPKDVPFHSQMQNELKKRVKDPLCSSNKFCFCCTRRHFMAALGAAALLPIHPSHASDVSSPANPMAMLNRLHPPRPDWYEEFYATAMNTSMKSYEAEIEGYKSELFANLRGQAKQILEIGIGTGPNLKYYASEGGTSVYGVDPNRKMEKYAQAAAETAGLPAANFKFLHARSEGCSSLVVFTSLLNMWLQQMVQLSDLFRDCSIRCSRLLQMVVILPGKQERIYLKPVSQM